MKGGVRPMRFIRELDGWVPVTRLYGDGDTYLAVSVIDYYTASGTEVFLCDADGAAKDADGDLTNGLTPLMRLPAGTPHDDAVRAAGYDLVEN